MHYAVPRILERAGMLHRFYTDICATKGWPRLFRALPEAVVPGALQRLRDRVPEGVPPGKITAFTDLGLRYAWKRYGAGGAEAKTDAHLWSGSAFTSRILSDGLGSVGGIYVFRSAGLELLRYARETKKMGVLEQYIAPTEVEHPLLREEQERHPSWTKPLEENKRITDYAKRERAEWEAADLILCSSDFVREGIRRVGGPVGRCVVVPYGVDLNLDDVERAKTRNDEPLHVLTVGSIGLRKGSPYVLRAAQLCGAAVSFRMVGAIGVTEDARSQLSRHVTLTGRVPRSEIQDHYAWADVFLLPSLCEGSATVTYEALAAGLPVICTSNTGSIVRDGKEGFLVPIRDAEAIAEKIEILASDPTQREEMSRQARRRYEDTGTMEAYGNRLVEMLMNSTGNT